jgi:hypothetical protein
MSVPSTRQGAAGNPDSVRPVLAALREDPDQRPVGVVSRVPCPRLDLARRDQVELVDNLQVGEVGETGECLFPVFGREADHGRHAGPLIVGES